MAARIEGDEIVIRIPVSAIPKAAALAMDEMFGFGNHDFEVTDTDTFAKALVEALNEEEPNTGATLVHKALDGAVDRAVERGAEGYRAPCWGVT